MPETLDNPDALRFACTGCGACCTRSPEVLLSEAAALSDVFVFRLMFRLYSLPKSYADYRRLPGRENTPADLFFEMKRLLSSFAARKYASKNRIGGSATENTNYLTISALTLDTGSGKCSALSDKLCSVYDRRPLSCKTVPFHFSRPEASAERELKAFVANPDYRCDTTASAPIAIQNGRLVNRQTLDARRDALKTAEQDHGWGTAIWRQIRTEPKRYSLPSLGEIEASALAGVLTTSMRVAWQIAADAGVIGADECKALVMNQMSVINREIALAKCSPEASETLVEMRTEYLEALAG